MAKPIKSQWDFGELFPTEQVRKILSVSELTLQIRRLLEKQIAQIWVTGEITNLRFQGSGHVYFTLKDAGAQLSCVLFRGEVQVDRSLLQDGRKVILQGELTVYEARGQYQLRVLSVELQGIGALQAAFEKLKQKLNAEGLFAAERKRSIPRYPQRIGLVTSPTGAAIRDVLHVIQRRNPALEIILVPCRVQGIGAAEEIAAIRLLNEFNFQQGLGDFAPARVSANTQEGAHSGQQSARAETAAKPWLDLILVTRGGGSLEDLWAFNEEIVARAVFESALPIVTGIGHEIDFTISDFVADLRAATPSAAAELITEGVFSSRQFLVEAGGYLRQLIQQRVVDKREGLSGLDQRLARVHPRRQLEERLQQLDELQTGLLRNLKQCVRRQRTAWQNLADRLGRVRPALLLKQRRDVFHQEEQRLREQARHHLEKWRSRLGAATGRLRLLGPEQVLARGYSITTDLETGRVLREAKEVKVGQRLRTRLKDGQLVSKVEPT